jgi:integrase
MAPRNEVVMHQQDKDRKLERTSTPGVFRRHTNDCSRRGRCDCSYVVTFRDRGRQHTETFRTFAEAREAKRARGSQVARGEFSGLARVTLREYALEWIDRYQGTGRRGLRDETREEYRAHLNKYTLRYFPPQTKLSEIDPRQVADFIGWLTRQPNGRGGKLSDSSVRNAFKPLSGCLATARREGLIRHNPAAEATLPHRPRIEGDEEERRPLSRAQLDAFLAVVHPDHRLMLEFTVRTGLRSSEVIGLDGRDLHLAGDQPHVKVRQRWRVAKRDGKLRGELGPVKSRYGRRNVPLAADLVDRLRALQAGPDAPVFPSQAGTRLSKDNIRNRYIKPAAEEVGAPWCGWHTLRHTCASILFDDGRNVVQVQRWLGHHKPSFTIDTYIHLLDDDLGVPLEPVRVNTGSTQRPETAAKDLLPETVSLAA